LRVVSSRSKSMGLLITTEQDTEITE
jgi:hypothetical protein